MQVGESIQLFARLPAGVVLATDFTNLAQYQDGWSTSSGNMIAALYNARAGEQFQIMAINGDVVSVESVPITGDSDFWINVPMADIIESGVAPYVPPVKQPPPGTTGGQVGVKFNLSWLLPLFTALAEVPIVGPWIAGIGDGAVLAFDALPAPLQDALIALFAAIGYNLIKGAGQLIVNDLLHPQGSGSGAGSGALVPPPGFVKAWSANGVQFYRNGRRLASVSKKRVRVWTPKKPIVLFRGGKMNIRELLKADKLLKREAEDLKRFIERRAGGTRAPRQKRLTVAEFKELSAGARR